jgi:hypothetical protein
VGTGIGTYNPAVVFIQKTYELDKGWVVRIKLRKVSRFALFSLPLAVHLI